MVLKTLELLCFINASGYERQECLPRFSHTVAEAVKEVYDYINQHFIDEITIGELASKFCISETNLSSCFKCLYGQPVGAYIRAKKLRYAAELLSGRTEMSVGDVAHLVGYGNQSKFASAFRTVYGYPPLEYRRRMKNNASEQKNVFGVEKIRIKSIIKRYTKGCAFFISHQLAVANKGGAKCHLF